MADREGRLEDRPKKVKMQVFPADNWDVDPMLSALEREELIVRYVVDSVRYIAIPAWSKHQNPHVKEKESTIPAPDSHGASRVNTEASPADSLIPDSLIPEEKKGQVTLTARFPDFWLAYPKKRKKKTALGIWRNKRLDAKADDLIADVQTRLRSDGQWLAGFIPDPTTYLNQERWDDELSPVTSLPAKSTARKPTYAEELAEDLRNAANQ
ncbi:MAG: hypothetical protein ACPGSC_13035 [Granulosicoccaceae bacterium]